MRSKRLEREWEKKSGKESQRTRFRIEKRIVKVCGERLENSRRDRRG